MKILGSSVLILNEMAKACPYNYKNGGSFIMKLDKIGQISINVLDINRAYSFYQDKLGFTASFKSPTMIFMDCGDTTLMLALPENEEFNHRSSTIYFNVSDIQNHYDYYKEKGVVFLTPPHLVADMGSYELWMAFFKDTEDNVLALMSEKPKK
jgi:predicted enzyme related to lactoylglutathione lyase